MAEGLSYTYSLPQGHAFCKRLLHGIKASSDKTDVVQGIQQEVEHHTLSNLETFSVEALAKEHAAALLLIRPV